jgi:hypothetical protein
LNALINIIRVITFQGIAFKVWDERVSSTDRENFLEILDLVVSYNERLLK